MSTQYILKRDRAVQTRRVDVKADAVAFVVRFQTGEIIKQSEPLTFAEAMRRRDALAAAGIELFEDGVRFFRGIGPVDGYDKAEFTRREPCESGYNERIVTRLGERAHKALKKGDDATVTACNIRLIQILEKVSDPHKKVHLRDVYREKVQGDKDGGAK